MCGSYRNDCYESAFEKHIFVGKEGENPSKLIVEYTKYVDPNCVSTTLLYNITVKADMYVSFSLIF